MTDKEKARAYDEAVNKIRRFMAQGVDPLITRTDVQDLFPELKESEGERIRKEIIDYFKSDWAKEEGITRPDWIDWLEKQGEKPQCRTELSEDERIRTGLIDGFNECLKNSPYQNIVQKYWHNIKIEDIIAWLEKEPVESKDDERLRKTTIAFLKDFANQGYENAVECIDWLEKLGGQKSSLFETPKTPIKDTTEVSSRMQSIDDDLKPIADFIIDYASWNLHKEEWSCPTLTVPLFRVLDALIQRGKPYIFRG